MINSNNIFLEKVSSTIKKFNMFSKSECLLVCLSGGADSTALLLCLYGLGYNIKACHIDHCLRGKESDRDREFCIELCRKYNIPIEVRRFDVLKFCNENGFSVEEGARKLRYQAFGEIECDKICTAHTLSDCLETTVFNLARGTGLKGLTAVPPVRDKIVRPLIECSREDVEIYLKDISQDFVTDSSNLKDEYSRNKIRHKIVPIMKEINSSVMKTYANTLDFLRADNDYLENTANEELEKCRCKNGFLCGRILSLSESIRRRIFISILKENDVEPSAEKIVRLENLAAHGGKINIKSNLFVIVSDDIMFFEKISKSNIVQNYEVIVDKLGEYEYMGRKVLFQMEKNFEIIGNVHKKFANCCLDYDKIKGEIIIRKRFPGDKIKLCERDFTSDVRKIVNKNFKAEERDKIILLSDDDGVVFVEGAGAAERVKIDKNTKKILWFKVLS